MFDDFLYRYRFYLGVFLILIISGGIWIVLKDKNQIQKTNTQNREVAELRQQNELLREQLSEISKQVAGEQSSSSDNQDLININTASEGELDALPGIGPVRAGDIISYRESRGGFKTIEEIKNIKGIGDKSFENLKDLITIGEQIE